MGRGDRRVRGDAERAQGVINSGCTFVMIGSSQSIALPCFRTGARRVCVGRQHAQALEGAAAAGSVAPNPEEARQGSG